MNVSRMDLADAASPDRLVLELLKHEPELSVPVPIEKLALQLDIVEIVPLKTEGYEGGLLTTADKYNGSILYNEGSPRTRKRFTIAHELGHFLIPSHLPSEDGKFLCRIGDMLELKANEGDRRQKMEVEANRFASLILMPPPILRPDVASGKDPDLRQIVRLAAKYDVSKEALCRAYVEMREEPVAVLVTQNGKLLRDYRVPFKFPRLTVARGQTLPEHTLLRRRRHQLGIPGEVDQTDAGVWIDVPRGRPAPTVYEQVLVQRNGFAMTLLWIEPLEAEEDEDVEAEMTSRERYLRRLAHRQ